MMYLKVFILIFARFAYGKAAVDIFERVEQGPNQFVAIDFISPIDDEEGTPSEDQNSIFADRPEAFSVNNEKLLFAELPKMKQANHSKSMLDYFHHWHHFKIEHGKKYTTFQEEKDRFKAFIANFEHVRLHNIAYRLGMKTYTTKLNEFADMTHEEFKETMNGFKRSLMDRTRNDNLDRRPFRIPLNFRAPDEVDWRDQGYVTPVKNQGHCGSCWAFSATGSLEGQHKRETGKLVSLSEQNLVDCSSKFGNEGCNGGLMDNAFQYIKQNKGIDTENSYPYEAKDGKCRFKKENIGADDVGFVDIESGNETALQLAIASQGPVSVAIDAGHKSFQFYEKGVYYEPKCSSEDLDHGVLAVGYGSDDNGAAYWLIKNSWGTTWGEDGYIKLARNRHNHCGVATQASYPSV